MADRMTLQQARELARQWAKRRVPAGPIVISWDEGKQATNKRPLTRNGHQSFTTDVNRLDDLFGSPMMTLAAGEVYGVGLWPGPASRVVLDIDTKGGKQGNKTLAALEAEHGPLPPHPIVDTASGGTHRWLAKPEGIHVGNPDLAEHIEVRADAGWVVAPGTFTPWGNWATREGTEIPAPMWPEWVAHRLNGHKPAGAGRTTGRWQKLDRAALDPRDFAALQALERLGGHGTVLGPAGEVRITRPGKQAGTSASVGYVDPGVVKVFTDDWAPLRKDAVYSVDELRRLVDGGADDSTALHDGARPGLRILSPATMAEWIRDHLGSGPLAGMFSRGNDIVFTPREGEDGYTEPRNSGDHDGPAQIRVLTPGMITARIQWTYRCYRLSKSGKNWYEEPALFPAAASTVAVNAADMIPGLRILHGVTHTPLVRADGSILTAAGYDPDTKLLHLPELGLAVSAVPDRPSGGDVKQAVTLLDEMVAGFPFVSEHHRANYLGYLLTPLLRELTPPPYKLCAITAPQPGSGKTLLATTMRIIHGGVFRAEMPEDEAELRKQVTAILDQTTGPVIHIDNVTGVLRSSTLAGLLTSNRWDDRRLGATEMVSRVNDRTWMITGNNVAIGGDLPRRTIPVVIDPGIPHPERRTGFAIADLEGWVADHRGELLWALLTLVRAWVIAGRPVGAEAGSDGYARWVRTIRGILTNAGIAGMFDDPDTRLDVGTDDDEWAEFLEAVYAVFGDQPWTVKELLAKFSGFPSPLSVDVLPSQLADKVDKVTGSVKPIGRSLGIWLRNREGRWSGDHTVRKAWTDRVGASCWVLKAHQGKDGPT